MLTKVKHIIKSENFTYFIRYFSVFTVIFITMTIIILQVMRTNIYRSTDDVLRDLSQNPENIMHLAKARTIGLDFTIEGIETTVSGEGEEGDRPASGTVRLGNNTNAVLFDSQGQIINSGDPFLGLDKLKLNPNETGRISEKPIKNYYEETEYYRYIVVKFDENVAPTIDLKYAIVLTNTSQLKATSESTQTIVIIVMISFWLVSIFAAMFLAIMTVRPILSAYEKQKSFVENASHELRTPLTVLQNRLETLFRKPNATILEASESIASSLDEVRNMRLLTTNLLNLARRDDGIKPVITDIPPSFFDNLFESYQMIAEDTEKQLCVNNLVTRTVKADETLLKQLITILFDNAVKYTDVDGQIELTVKTTERQLIISIADDGLGISDSDKRKIFDRFYRVDKARTRQKGGFGLGLSLAKQIVDSLRGLIIVKDNQPRGTIFEVRFNR